MPRRRKLRQEKAGQKAELQRVSDPRRIHGSTLTNKNACSQARRVPVSMRG
jgi:hypothetical protein